MKITQDQRDRVRQMIEWGHCKTAICAELGLSRYHVTRIITEDRLPKPVNKTGQRITQNIKASKYRIVGGRINWTPKLVALIESERNSGTSWDDIAEKIGLGRRGESLKARYWFQKKYKPRHRGASVESPKPHGWWARLKTWLFGSGYGPA